LKIRIDRILILVITSGSGSRLSVRNARSCSKEFIKLIVIWLSSIKQPEEEEPNLVTLSWPGSQRWMFRQVLFEHESAINTHSYTFRFNHSISRLTNTKIAIDPKL